MDTQKIIDALKQERERLDRAIAVLRGSSPGTAVGSPRSGASGARKGRRRMSPEARARIAAAQRRRWAKVKAKRAVASGGTAKKK
ncbi:MAG: hypothetical protein ACJ71Q_16600 [Terriglobales bacterium]|jgi:hypothetical protein